MAGTVGVINKHTIIDELAIRAPTYVDTKVLAADTSKQQSIPSGADYCVFSADGDFYAKPNGGGSVAVPSADETGGDDPFLNPTVWQVTGLSNIEVVAGAARVVSMAFYKRPGN